MSGSSGTISSTGLFTAPASIATLQTITVTATSVADPTKSASATVTLTPAATVIVNPISVALASGQSQQFTATVSNITNTGVTWTIIPNLGTISSSGLYAAPTSVSSQQAVTVTAQSVSDPSRSASATVTVTPPQNTGTCLVAYTNTNDWGTGFTGSLFITNNSSSAINGWTLTWTWSGNQSVTSSWSSSYVQNGAMVTLTDAGWNGTIAPGASISGVGFNANYGGTNVDPAVFYLNGVQCNGSGTSAATPATPSSLSASAVSSSEIDLSWTTSTSAGVSYNVYASISPGVSPSSALRIATGITGTTFQHRGLVSSTAYYYVVTAVNAIGESAVSNEATATSGGASCHVDYANINDWGSGFTGQISIVNTDVAAIQGWILTWQWPGDQMISGSWNASLSQTGSSVMLTNLQSNAGILPGATLSGIGFNADGSSAVPVTFRVNGVVCR